MLHQLSACLRALLLAPYLPRKHVWQRGSQARSQAKGQGECISGAILRDREGALGLSNASCFRLEPALSCSRQKSNPREFHEGRRLAALEHHLVAGPHLASNAIPKLALSQSLHTVYYIYISLHEILYVASYILHLTCYIFYVVCRILYIVEIILCVTRDLQRRVHLRALLDRLLQGLRRGTAASCVPTLQKADLPVEYPTTHCI